MRFLLLLITITIFFSCGTQPKTFDPDKWYKKTKELILKESNVSIDSIKTENYETGQRHKVKSFSGGRIAFERWYRESGEQVAQINYATNRDLEIRQEICQSGKIAFEGIFYKGNSYGLSTWWGCGKYKQDEGIRFNDKKIGIWKKYSENGDSTLTDYGNSNYVDSLNYIIHFENY